MSTYYTNIQVLGPNILFRGIENGKRVKARIPYKPSLYIRSKNSNAKFRSLNKEPLDQIEFGSIYEAREFAKTYQAVDNFKIFGNTNYTYAYISDTFPDLIDFDVSKILVGYLDIEVASENGFPDPAHANETVTAITLQLNKTFVVFGYGDFVIPEGRTDIKYLKCKDEKELISTFVDVWVKYMPDIISGWSIAMFDIPYLINRMRRLFLEDLIPKLSPWGKVNDRATKIGGKEVQFYDILGVAVLDYIDLYKKFAPHPNQENYKLGTIATVELGEAKIDYSEYDNLHTLYKRNYQLFMEYNIKDVDLVSKLEGKLKLIELAMQLAYDNKVNFEDVFSQVRMWDSIIYNHLRKKGIIIPPKTDTIKSSQFIGAYVKEPKPGMYKWGSSFDLDGLYPHLIMMYNLSPETLVTGDRLPNEVAAWHSENIQNISIDGLLHEKLDTSILRKYNLTMTPNGAFFDRTKQGFLPELMETMYDDRKKYKSQMIEFQKQREVEKDPIKKEELASQIAKYNNFQNAKKVTLNSAYGAIGNEYFRFFDIRIAEAVTTSGQLSVRWIERKLNEYLSDMLKVKKDYVIASDTDSIYLNLGDMIAKTVDENKVDRVKISNALDSFCSTKLQPYIDQSFRELTEYVYAYQHKMRMKREAIFDRAIWTAKKHYILNVYNNEGVQYAEPKIKIKGLEAVKSSTPTVVRDKMKAAFKIIMTQEQSDLIRFVDEFKVQFKQLPVEDVGSPRGCNGLADYADAKTIWGYKTPMHVKGALVYNHLLKEKNLSRKFQEIKEGEKLKYMYLKSPNPVQCNVISFPISLPKELELHPFLDFDTQFDKTFVDPLMIVLRAIGWRLEQNNTLDSFFS